MWSFETFSKNLLAVCVLWRCTVDIFSENWMKQGSLACCRHPVPVDSAISCRHPVPVDSARSCCRHPVPVDSASSCCRHPLPVDTASSCCRHPVSVDSTRSCCRHPVPVDSASSCCRHPVPVDSASSCRHPVPVDSASSWRHPVPVDSVSSNFPSHPAANAKCVTARSPDALLQVQPPSPQPSVDRLSVTFAPEERSFCSDSSVRMNAFAQGSPPASNMEKVHFSREPTVTGCRPSFLCNLSFIVLCFLLYSHFQLFLSIVFAQLFVSRPPSLYSKGMIYCFNSLKTKFHVLSMRSLFYLATVDCHFLPSRLSYQRSLLSRLHSHTQQQMTNCNGQIN